MLIAIDPEDTRTLHDQLVAGLRNAIRVGEVHPGDRLPAARDLAASLDINVHTVLKAYGHLRDDGLIQMRRGRGAIVMATPGLADVHDAARSLLAAGRRHGLSVPQLHAVLDDLTEGSSS